MGGTGLARSGQVRTPMMCTMFSYPRVMAVGLLALWLPPSPVAAQLFGGFSDEPVTVRGQSAELFIEPKGHGIEAYRGDDAQRRSAEQRFVIYRYDGCAEEPRAGRVAFGNTRRESVAYDLVPLYSTLLARAHGGANQTFGDDFAYAPLSVRARQRSGDDAVLDVSPGALGASFRGAVGGRNMARPPWGWFDSRERERPLGEWFLDPAGVVARHFMPDEPFSFTYVHHPYVGIAEDP